MALAVAERRAWARAGRRKAPGGPRQRRSATGAGDGPDGGAAGRRGRAARRLRAMGSPRGPAGGRTATAPAQHCQAPNFRAMTATPGMRRNEDMRTTARTLCGSRGVHLRKPFPRHAGAGAAIRSLGTDKRLSRKKLSMELFLASCEAPCFADGAATRWQTTADYVAHLTTAWASVN